MPHLTAPGTLVALNYESYPTAPSTSSIFADLAAQWAAFSGGASAGMQIPMPPPLPLPLPCGPGTPVTCPPGVGPSLPLTPTPTPSGPSALDQCKADCRRRFFTCVFESGPLKCSCFQACEQSGGQAEDGLTRFGGILGVVVGIVLVLIAVALIVR